jgi:adenosylcobinamide-GDP ribazoletransferase
MSVLPTNLRNEFLGALAFLTRLPVRPVVADSAAAELNLAAASWAFPLVGIAIGIIGGGAYVIAVGLGLPPLAAALIAIGATAIATGGLHEDGLADTTDGFGGGATREEKLGIMRDSRTGVYGVLALVFSVALRVVALGQIATGWRVIGALIAAHALARGLLPAVLRLLEPARSDGLGVSAGRPEQGVVLWSLGIALIVTLLAAGLRPGLSAVFAAVLVATAIAWLAQRQIGGYTGDVLGAIEQGGEVAALLAIAAWAS